MKARARPDSASAPCGATGRGVAGRQDHPVGVELEGGHLGGRQITVVQFSLLLRRREDQPRLAGAFDLTGERAVGGEVQHPVLRSLPWPLSVLGCSVALAPSSMSSGESRKSLATAHSSSAVSCRGICDLR